MKMLERDWYTPKEVAKMIFMSYAWVCLRLGDGTLPGHKIGDRWVIPKTELERWMKDHEDFIRNA